MISGIVLYMAFGCVGRLQERRKEKGELIIVVLRRDILGIAVQTWRPYGAARRRRVGVHAPQHPRIRCGACGKDVDDCLFLVLLFATQLIFVLLR